MGNPDENANLDFCKVQIRRKEVELRKEKRTAESNVVPPKHQRGSHSPRIDVSRADLLGQ